MMNPEGIKEEKTKKIMGKLKAMGNKRFGLPQWFSTCPGEGNRNPLQYSWLGNPTGRGAWQATVHWVTRGWHDLETKPPPPLMTQQVKNLPARQELQETWVQCLGWEDILEKEMATHSSTLAWKIWWTEEPGRLQSMGSQRLGHDWATSLSLLRVVLTTLPSPQICCWCQRWEQSSGGLCAL